MAPPYSSFDYSPQFVFQANGFAANSVNSSHIINGTITGTDIATGTITNANFVNGAITPEKLSSALQTKLEDFDTRIAALENAGDGGAGWSGNIVFTRTSGAGSNIVIYLKTDAGFIANAATYPANNTFAVSLPTPESYLYVNVQSGGGGWEVGTQGFDEDEEFGEPTSVFENNVLWNRYVLGGYDMDTLNYDFTTYYDD
jgi:hypothetical protein